MLPNLCDKADWCLLIHGKYVELILAGKKTWEVRPLSLFKKGERIALGNTDSKCVVAYATVCKIKKMTVAEMKQHNDKHFANEFIDKHWKDRPFVYAHVLAEVEPLNQKLTYPRSYGSPKVRLR